MRLTQLSLQGFKSFGNRVTVEFAPGITGIVGPNGSGKSNLLDALKWVTGGGRAKAFRAEAKTDLIFHGADGKRGLSYAEVEVELSDGHRSIKVRRDMDREGHSHLRLDGRVARFIDVDDALAGSGLGTAGVAVIGQGEVAGVLLADPATLLGYVAEAAGVARLAGRREQTLSRLEGARGHLARLDDVLIELRERTAQLEKEAEAALRHGELSREALVLRVTAAHARVRGLEDEVGQLRSSLALAEQELLEGRESLVLLREARELAGRLREEQETAYRLRSAEVERAQGLLRLARSEASRLSERRTHAEERLGSAKGELATLSQLKPPQPPAEDAEALKEEAVKAALAAAHLAEARSEAQIGLRAAEAELEERRQGNELLRRAWAEHRARSEGIAAELAKAEEAAGELQAQAGSSGSDPVQAAQEAQARLATALDQRTAAQEALEARRTEMETAHALHAEAYAEHQARSRSAAQLRSAFEARRGYAQGPKAALTSSVPGVIGSVADLLRVAPDRQAAIAAALGRRAEYVVVEDADCAEAVLQAVRRAGAWVTLLPLDLLRASAEHRAPLEQRQDELRGEGLLGWATDAVEVDPAYRVVVQSLLANTLLVQDMATATAIARRRNQRPRLVTLDGDLVEASGAISGGRRPTATSVLGAAKDVEEAEAVSSHAAEALAAAELALAHARTAFTASKETADATHKAVLEAQEAAAGAERALAVGRERLAEAEARIARLRSAQQAVVAPTEEPDEASFELAVAMEQQAREAMQRIQAEVEAAVARRAECDRAADVARERSLAYRALQERFEQALQRMASLSEEIARTQAEADGLRQEEGAAAEAVRAAEAALPQDLESQREAFEAAQHGLRTAEAALQQQQADLARLGETVETTRLGLARREAALELALEERAVLPEGVDPMALGERSARGRLREVELAMEELGAINHRAADDHREQAERLAVLEAEVAQATLAMEELGRTLDSIDAETNERLGVSLANLRTAFSEHVTQLFGEGAVGLIEVEQEGPRPVGLRIQLQPPGKRTRSLSLLSVGERTMGAMAFLFALMAGEAERLPIAVLDEVDAPLDEANIRRFCGFVTSLAAKGTQFVLITHQKATFEVADTLWGVTTEQGVSRVFSIRRDGALGTLLEA